MTGESFAISDLARMLGRDRSTVSRAIRAAGLEGADGPGRRKLYSLPEVIAAMPSHLIGHDHDEAGLDLTAETARLKKLQADRVQLDLEVQRGDVIPAADVEATWTDLCLRMRAKMLAIPHQAPALVGLTAGQIQKALQQSVEDALTELSTDRGPDDLEVSSDE